MSMSFIDDSQVLAKYTCENEDGTFDVYDNYGDTAGESVTHQVALTLSRRYDKEDR
jgi:hypothetical protein